MLKLRLKIEHVVDETLLVVEEYQMSSGVGIDSKEMRCVYCERLAGGWRFDQIGFFSLFFFFLGRKDRRG